MVSMPALGDLFGCSKLDVGCEVAITKQLGRSWGWKGRRDWIALVRAGQPIGCLGIWLSASRLRAINKQCGPERVTLV